MRRSREDRVISSALCCYPARWRSRHGVEAAELASALLDDGTPWWAIAASFLGSAAKEQVFRRPTLRTGSAIAAIILGITVAPLALFASLTPASASGTGVTIVISKTGDAAHQLKSAFATHHFRITVVERTVSTDVVGSILSVNTAGAASSNAGTIGEVYGRCNGGESGCVVGLVLPTHYSGVARVTVGVLTTAKNAQYHFAEIPRLR